MNERTRHTHRCPCGTSWDCSKPDCRLEDECTACEERTFEDFAHKRAWDVSQLRLRDALPEEF